MCCSKTFTHHYITEEQKIILHSLLEDTKERKCCDCKVPENSNSVATFYIIAGAVLSGAATAVQMILVKRQAFGI